MISNGRMLFAGAEVKALAEKYGTPFYAMDEQKLRENMRTYVVSMKKAFGENALPMHKVQYADLAGA